MAFKGVLPSDLWLKYNQEGGAYLMELDTLVALEINDRIAEATAKAEKRNAATTNSGLKKIDKDDAQAVIARRNARREARKKQQEDLSDTSRLP